MKEANRVFRWDEEYGWTWMAECVNPWVAECTAEYWANANPGEEYAYGTSEDDLHGTFCR